MHPVTHFLTGWLVAESASLTRRERAAVTLAAVVADIDGLGYIVERLTLDSPNRLLWYSDYHHQLTHNVLFAVIVALCCFLISGYETVFAQKGWDTHAFPESQGATLPRARPLLAAGLGLLVFHLHILADVVGSRGPDGSQWPIPYFWPFYPQWKWTWSGQWELNAWPNFVITILALALTFYLACQRGYSPLGMVSKRADRKFVETLRRRFGGQHRDSP